MDHPTEDTTMTLNANRNAGDPDAPHLDAAPAASSTAPAPETVNRIAAPVVVATFDWKKWMPWILGALVLLLLVWLLSRKRGGAGGGSGAA